MDINEIKQALEAAYLVGFRVRGTMVDCEVTLDGSSKDRFKLHSQFKDGVRLVVEVEPEKYGANFLRLLNSSDKNRRKGLISLLNEVDDGKVEILINNSPKTNDDFVNDTSEWKSFKLKYQKIPCEDVSLSKNVMVTMCGMILSLVDYSVEGYEEGTKTEIHVSKYERNPLNRKICLAAKGYKCSVCGFDFENYYGEVGKKTIEVHHTLLVSEMGANHVVDPIKELVPVCSNCHTIIHKKNPPYSVDEVKEMIAEAARKQADS